jgi:hypothetical protein
MTFPDGLINLAKDREISARAWRVLALLMGKLDFENYILTGGVASAARRDGRLRPPAGTGCGFR